MGLTHFSAYILITGCNFSFSSYLEDKLDDTLSSQPTVQWFYGHTRSSTIRVPQSFSLQSQQTIPLLPPGMTTPCLATNIDKLDTTSTLLPRDRCCSHLCHCCRSKLSPPACLLFSITDSQSIAVCTSDCLNQCMCTCGGCQEVRETAYGLCSFCWEWCLYAQRLRHESGPHDHSHRIVSTGAPPMPLLSFTLCSSPSS